MEWVIENKEWLFSGLGLSILGIVGYFTKIKTDKNKSKQYITSGENSTNIQGGNNVNVKIGDKNDK